MGSVWYIAAHEIRCLYSDFRLLASVASVLLIIPLSLFILTRIDEEEYTRYLKHRVSLQDQVAAATNLSHLDLRVALPPPPLAFLNRGVLDQIESEYRMSRLEPPFIGLKSSEGSWLSYFFPSLDIASIIVVLYSIIPFMFGYSVFSKEKEAGTLRLVLANSLSRARLILGKVLGLTVGLLPSFLFLFLLSLGAALVVPNIRENMTGSDWSAFLLFFLLVWIYALLMLQFAVLVSVLTHTSSNSLLSLLVVWLLTLIIIPVISLASAEYFLPSRKTNVFRTQRLQLNTSLLDEYIQALEASVGTTISIPEKVLANPGIKAFSIRLRSDQFFLTREGRLVANFITPETEKRFLAYLPQLVRRQQALVTQKENLYLEHLRYLMRQREHAAGAAYFSPPALFQDLAAELVGTGARTVFRSYQRLTYLHGQFVEEVAQTDQFNTSAFFSSLPLIEAATLGSSADIDLLRMEREERPMATPELIFYGGYSLVLLLCLFVASFVGSIRYDPR